jgi:hypothetical protein
MMVWRLWGGLDDGTCSKENFGGKFWQLDDASESLWGFGFVKAVQ